MYKRILRGALAVLLVNLTCHAPVAADSEPQENESAAKVKADVFKIGIGPGALAKVRLHDGTKLKGYIREASEEGFVIVDWETGSATRLAYAQVKQVKRIKKRKLLTLESLGYIAIFGLMIVTGIAYARKDGCGSCALTPELTRPRVQPPIYTARRDDESHAIAGRVE